MLFARRNHSALSNNYRPQKRQRCYGDPTSRIATHPVRFVTCRRRFRSSAPLVGDTPSDRYPIEQALGGVRGTAMRIRYGVGACQLACVSVVGAVAPRESASHSPHLETRGRPIDDSSRGQKSQFERRVARSRFCLRFLLDPRNLLAGDDAGLGRATRAVNDDVLNRGSPMTADVPRQRRRPRPLARPTPRYARARHPRTRKTSSPPFAVPRALAPLPANHGCFYNASKKGSVRNKGQSAFSGGVFSPEKDALSCRCVSKAGNLNDNERATRRCARPRHARGSLPRVRLPDRFFSRNVARERKVPLFRSLLPTSMSTSTNCVIDTRAGTRHPARCSRTCSRARIRGQRIDEQLEGADASFEDIFKENNISRLDNRRSLDATWTHLERSPTVFTNEILYPVNFASPKGTKSYRVPT
jgi:hypothetical protein